MGKADLHMHSTISDCILTPQMIITLHRKRNRDYMEHNKGLKWRDVIAITDHDEIKGAQEAAEIVYKSTKWKSIDPIVLVGEEVTTLEGHVLAINIKERIPPRMSAEETIAAIHEQNGFAIAAHPYTIAHYFLKRQKGLLGVGKLIYELPFDGVEVINANITEKIPNLWLKYVLNNNNFALLGNSDAHFSTAFTANSDFEGETAQDLFKAIRNKSTTPQGRTYSWFDMARGYKEHQEILKICERVEGVTLPNADIWQRAMNPVLFNLLQYTSKLY